MSSVVVVEVVVVVVVLVLKNAALSRYRGVRACIAVVV